MPATRSIRRRLGLVLFLVVAVATLAACDNLTAITGPREWSETTTAADGTTHTVTVRDTSGRLTNVEFDPQGVDMVNEITNPPGQPNVVLVPWTGGACDVKTDITFAAAGEGLDGTIRTTTTGQVCIMMAILHQLRLTANGPLPAAQVTLNPAP